ncbi:MAG TPA: hypothetical protein PKY56_01715 [Candidatus Kapabacteria bacterium]|nr:hypothetical protein [Candidatus Kapabacteria bacterium]HPO62036.1 hypothetical protein [Candidatus Kapabacteria bacterium]
MLLKKIKNIKSVFVVVLFISAFIIKLSFSIVFGEFENPELYEHGMIAKCMLESGNYTMHWPYPPLSEERIKEQQVSPHYKKAWIPPINPFILFLFLKVFGITKLAYFLYILLNILLSSLTVLVVYYLSKEFLTENASRASAIISLLYLPNTHIVITFSGAPIYHLLSLIVIWLIIKNIKSVSTLNLILLGISSALLCLTRSEFLGLMILYFFIMIIIFKFYNQNKYIRNISIAIASFLFILMPWTIRNYNEFNKFIPVTSHPWHEIWRGNNPLSTGGAIASNGRYNWLGFDASHTRLINIIDSIPLNNRFELVVDSVFKEEVLTYWRNEPLKALTNMFKRGFYYWTTDLTDSKSKDIKLIIVTYPVLICILCGLWCAFKERKKRIMQDILIIFSAFFIFYTITVAVININIRYQVYLYSTLMPFTGIGFYFLKNLIFKKKEQLFIS